MRILVLQHEAGAPAGLLGEWARERGHELHVAAVAELERWPQARDFDAVVSLGAESSVSGGERWIEPELAYLREAHEDGVPLLGICFGAQALAAALGGSVSQAPQIAVEWSAPDELEGELIPPGAWLRWHEDVFTLPPGAREIARADGVPLAFQTGASVGLQFHPEADAAIARGWIEASRSSGSRVGREQLLALERALESDGPAARERAYELFDRIAELWLRI